MYLALQQAATPCAAAEPMRQLLELAATAKEDATLPPEHARLCGGDGVHASTTGVVEILAPALHRMVEDPPLLLFLSLF